MARQITSKVKLLAIVLFDSKSESSPSPSSGGKSESFGGGGYCIINLHLRRSGL